MQKSIIPVISYNEHTKDDIRMLERAFADSVILLEKSDSDAKEAKLIADLKLVTEETDLQIWVDHTFKTIDSVKKVLYTGVSKVILAWGTHDEKLIENAIKKFSAKKICVGVTIRQVTEVLFSRFQELGIKHLVYSDMGKRESALKKVGAFFDVNEFTYTLVTDECNADEIAKAMKHSYIKSVASTMLAKDESTTLKFKNKLNKLGIIVNLFKSNIPFSEFKLNNDGLIPVIVQDYKSGEILMLAYMNEESYEQTILTGKMTYYSRSRKAIWVKGETSGHFQFVKSMDIDCDNDTILAKVEQIGPACHTGNHSCFYRSLAAKDYNDRNPVKILSEVSDIISDRRNNPKEGSYTNYLFNSGIDKILKKVGEEASEIIIAAKNPNKEETVYEIADFLYHMMVLMSEKNISWKDITHELARRK